MGSITKSVLPGSIGAGRWHSNEKEYGMFHGFCKGCKAAGGIRTKRCADVLMHARENCSTEAFAYMYSLAGGSSIKGSPPSSQRYPVGELGSFQAEERLSR